MSSGGAIPCHIVTGSTGRSVFSANYTGGSVGSYRTDAAGKLIDRTSFHQHEGSSILKPRQATPHAHSTNLDPTGRFAYVPDLGLDKIWISIWINGAQAARYFETDRGDKIPRNGRFGLRPTGRGVVQGHRDPRSNPLSPPTDLLNKVLRDTLQKANS